MTMKNLASSCMAVLCVVLCAATILAASASGCKTGKFPGTYTRVDPPSDVFGDGSVIHQYVFQLTLHADGTASQYWTGLPDFALNSGTGSTNIGSWQCRNDGMLIVNLLSAAYVPVAPAASHPLPDLSLLNHSRVTLLFRVDDDNTLTRVQARGRRYGAADDPTNTATGILGPLVTTQVAYHRLSASDADLLLP